MVYIEYSNNKKEFTKLQEKAILNGITYKITKNKFFIGLEPSLTLNVKLDKKNVFKNIPINIDNKLVNYDFVIN